MNNIVYKKCKYDKVVFIIFTTIMLALISYGATKYPEKLFHNSIYAILFLLYVINIFRFFSFKVVVSNDTIYRRDLRTRTILYKEVISAEIFKRNLTLFTKDTRICIEEDLERYREVIGFIVNKIKDNPKIDIYGDNDIAESYGLKISE